MGTEFPDVKSIFGRAIEISSPADRAAYLDHACGNDRRLREEVESLLRAGQEGRGFFQAVHPYAETVVDKPIAEPLLGAEIGPFKLLRLIGEGGMGTVFMAEQSEPVQRTVALKIVKRGMDSQQVIARFEAERQALAVMDHPGIAKVFDAGTTPDGRPYFVMELVKGLPITRYCDEHHLTPKARLELFVGVCQAVQHAHQKGIIHRDLKPSNVLVAEYDGKPLPKVIDFGVAKATGPRLTENTLFTELGQLVGTLEYMSPEQAKFNTLDIDTRSDIYALGVLLYELLTGTTPFGKNLFRQAAFDEVLRIIREDEPPKPSTRLSTTEELPSVAANRGVEPKKLSGQVRGELDWIVMKALEKERTRRYETANGLAHDIERYLHDEPVQACPPSASYRARKFVRRNRVPVIAATVVVLALFGATVLSVFWARREQLARWDAVASNQAADAARREAEKNFRQARRAVDEMYTQVAKKWLADQPQMEPLQRDFLQKALTFYEEFARESNSDPAVRFEAAEAYVRVAEIQDKLGDPGRAEKAFSHAIPILQSLVDEFPNEPQYKKELTDALHSLGSLLGGTGRDSEEEQTHRRALVLQQKLVAMFPAIAAHRRALARGLYHLGCTNEVWSGHFNEWKAVLDQAIDIQRQLVAEFPIVPEYRAELADSYSRIGDLQSKREAVAILEKLVADHPDRPGYRWSLGDAYDRLARWASPAEGEKTYRQAIAVREKVLADFPTVPGYRFDLTHSYLFLANALLQLDKIDAAESTYRQSLAVGDRLLAVPKVDYYRKTQATAHDELGDLLVRTKRYREAATEYRQSIALYENLAVEFPRKRQNRARFIVGQVKLSWVLAKTGQAREADLAYQRATKMSKELGVDSVDPTDIQSTVGVGFHELAQLLRFQGELFAAREMSERAIGLQKGALKANPHNTTYRERLTFDYQCLANMIAQKWRTPKSGQDV